MLEQKQNVRHCEKLVFFRMVVNNWKYDFIMTISILSYITIDLKSVQNILFVTVICDCFVCYILCFFKRQLVSVLQLPSGFQLLKCLENWKYAFILYFIYI